MIELLAAQYPVLTWWALVTILTRAARPSRWSRLCHGRLLVRRGEITVGQVVSFVAFATLLIGKLDQLSHFFRAIQQKPAIDAYFDLVDTDGPILDKPGAVRWPRDGRMCATRM